MNSLHEECENLKRLNQGEHQKLFKDLESKSKVVTELSNEVIEIIRNGSTILSSFSKKNKHKTILITGREAQIDRSRSPQEQGRDRAQVSTQDSRYGGTDGKA